MVEAVIAVLWFAALLIAADVSGVWSIEFERDPDSGAYRAECTFKQEGDRLTGSCLGETPGSAPVPITGKVSDRDVTFQYRTSVEGSTVTFSGRLDERETSMKGSWQFVDRDGNKGAGQFTATKD
jgi:hypothetical protein